MSKIDDIEKELESLGGLKCPICRESTGRRIGRTSVLVVAADGNILTNARTLKGKLHENHPTQFSL